MTTHATAAFLRMIGFGFNHGLFPRWQSWAPEQTHFPTSMGSNDLRDRFSCAIPRSFEDGAHNPYWNVADFIPKVVAENRLEGRAAVSAAARESVGEDTGKS
jgi:hypothetical protein